MKEYTAYECEMCGAIFDNKEDCEKCEKNHFKVVRCRYEYKYGGLFPERVILVMENNATATYKVTWGED